MMKNYGYEVFLGTGDLLMKHFFRYPRKIIGIKKDPLGVLPFMIVSFIAQTRVNRSSIQSFPIN
jgi:hypothetical protein